MFNKSGLFWRWYWERMEGASRLGRWASFSWVVHRNTIQAGQVRRIEWNKCQEYVECCNQLGIISSMKENPQALSLRPRKHKCSMARWPAVLHHKCPLLPNFWSASRFGRNFDTLAAFKANRNSFSWLSSKGIIASPSSTKFLQPSCDWIEVVDVARTRAMRYAFEVRRRLAYIAFGICCWRRGNGGDGQAGIWGLALR